MSHISEFLPYDPSFSTCQLPLLPVLLLRACDFPRLLLAALSHLIPRWPHWKPRGPTISFVPSSPASQVPKVPQRLSSAGRKFICLLYSMFYFGFDISLNSRFLSVPSSWTTLTDPHMAGFPFHSSLTQHWCLFLRRSSVTTHSVVVTPHPSSLSRSHPPPGSLSN